MSGRFFSSTENRPRPWLCMVRHEITRCIVTSAHCRLVTEVDELVDLVFGRCG